MCCESHVTPAAITAPRPRLLALYKPFARAVERRSARAVFSFCLISIPVLKGAPGMLFKESNVMIFPLRVHFLAIYFESSHFPPKTNFQTKNAAFPQANAHFQFFSHKNARVWFSQGVCSRQLRAKMKYQQNTAATNA